MDRIMIEEKQTAVREPLLRRVSGVLTCSKVSTPLSFFLIFALSYTIGFFSATLPLNHSPSAPSPLPTSLSSNVSGTAFPDHNKFWVGCTKPIATMLVRKTIFERLYNGTSPYDNFPPPHAAPLLQTKSVPPHDWGSTGSVFENLIWKVKPRIIVEVGSFLGFSAIHMAQLTTSLGLKTQIVCIDDFRGWPEFRYQFPEIGILNGNVMLMYQFMQNVISSNVAESIIPMPFASDSSLEKLCEWGVMADLIEVDAGHDFHSAWSDINRAYKILRPGGVIFGHDYFNAMDNYGVRRAVDRFAQVKGLKVRAEGEHWVLE